MRSPVPDDVRLHLVPGGGLPPPVVKALNENVERVNRSSSPLWSTL
jgi:hypothetical protein